MNILTPEEETLLIAHLAWPLVHRLPPQPGQPQPGQSAAQWKARRNLLAFSLMLDAGLRVGELIALLTNDLYFNHAPVRMLTVRAAIAKGKQTRSIPISQRILEFARLFRPQPSLTPYLNDTHRLVTNKPQGHALSTRQVERIITNAAQHAIARPLHPHALRHTFATRLMHVTDMRTVQELLGHKNMASTQIYTHVNDLDKRRAIEALALPAPATSLPPLPT